MKRRWVVAVAITGSLFFVFGSHLAAGSYDEVYDAQSAMIMSRYGHDSIFKCFRSSAGLLDCLYQVTVKR